MDSSPQILVEVAYAEPDRQRIIPLMVESGATAEQAIRHSGILTEFPQIDLGVNKIGIFGKHASLQTPLRARDRVEIYRPLIADPKDIRRKRVAEGRDLKKR
ncbi:RnfH family protein [Methylovorus sp. MP688]|jgi:uncharacterized protein|uniref:RnfH family protein n=1 Tax=Methylovorus sp. (strain MP688) TaxID=887061 RepID=UPI0001EC4683|nr:RnfH family protein [Methylovorus sp. MP688]ADQ84464.1 conserved hypothetical protein [Methylovorus sp. MP688]